MDHASHTHDNESAHSFGKDYWEKHWAESHERSSGTDNSGPNPYLSRETNGLAPKTALDAGCGTGTEAIWLASQGWRVVGADISPQALERAAERATEASVSLGVTWLEADLSTWEPDNQFDLVMTNYAHPAMPQLAFYERLAGWVAPAGTLLIVGHLNQGEFSMHPVEATATVAAITALLGVGSWRIDTAEEVVRTVSGGPAAPLRDVVVRATRLG